MLLIGFKCNFIGKEPISSFFLIQRKRTKTPACQIRAYILYLQDLIIGVHEPSISPRHQKINEKPCNKAQNIGI